MGKISQEKLVEMAAELHMLTEQSRVMEKKRDAIKAELKAELPDGCHSFGNVVIEIKVQARTTLDRKALEDALGEDNIEPFLKTSTNRQLEVRPVLEVKKSA